MLETLFDVPDVSSQTGVIGKPVLHQEHVSESQVAKQEPDASFINIILKQQVHFYLFTLNHFVSAVLAERCFDPFQNQTPYTDIEGDKIFFQ